MSMEEPTMEEPLPEQAADAQASIAAEPRVDEKLAVDKFNVDEKNAHIALVQSPDSDEFSKLMACCPAGLYQCGDDGEFLFDYAGCLECGSCRILCGSTIIDKWEYPKDGAGISYRYG